MVGRQNFVCTRHIYRTRCYQLSICANADAYRCSRQLASLGSLRTPFSFAPHRFGKILSWVPYPQSLGRWQGLTFRSLRRQSGGPRQIHTINNAVSIAISTAQLITRTSQNAWFWLTQNLLGSRRFVVSALVSIGLQEPCVVFPATGDVCASIRCSPSDCKFYTPYQVLCVVNCRQSTDDHVCSAFFYG